MTRYSKEYKLAIARKLAASTLTDRQFAKQEGLAFTTPHSWKVKYSVERMPDEKPSDSEKWSSVEKFSVVLETVSLAEIEFHEYCRAKGLYPDQVRLWKEACMQGV